MKDASRVASEYVRELLRDGSELQREVFRQNNLIYGALIGAGLIMVQPFLTAGSLDLPARICVLAFSVAIPLLAALVLLNQQEIFRHRAANSRFIDLAQVVAQGCAFVGLVAAFWHIFWIAGVTILASAIVGMAVHSVGYTRLEIPAELMSREVERSGDSTDRR